jgi:hypothetical protein
MQKEKRSFKNHNDEIMKKLLIPEFIQSIHQTLLLACLEYYIVFEADALLKFDTNLTGKVKCKRISKQ